MRNPARISHRIPGRVRLRIPERRGDEAYFLGIAEELSFDEGIERITTTAETASLLLEHNLSDTELDALLDKWFELEDSEQKGSERKTAPAVSGTALESGEPLASLRRLCSEPNSLQSATALLLIAHGLWRLQSGQLRGPDWFNAFWVAFNLLRMGK